MSTNPPSISKLLDHFAAGAILAAGQEVGLVKAMTDDATPRTSEELAAATGLKERYVREWLHGLTVLGYVVATPGLDENPDPGVTLKYAIHQNYIGELKEGFGATFLNMFPHLIADGYTKTVECFARDGPKGVPYEAYPNVHSLIDRSSEAMYGKMVIPAFVPALPEDLRKSLESGIKVADVGSGFGVVTRILAKAFPKSTFLGVDLCQVAVDGGNAKAAKEGLPNLHFEKHEAASLPQEWSDTFDFVMVFDMIHDSGRPDLVLKEIERILKPGAVFSFLDIYGSSDVRKNIPDVATHCKYVVSLFHCMPVSLAQRDGMGLGVLWGIEKARQMLTTAGFEIKSLGQAPFSEHNMLGICRKKKAN